MRRKVSGWLFGMLVILRVSLTPAHASLFTSLYDAMGRVRDALPVRVALGPSGSLTAAQRDSVRRVRLARLSSLAAEQPPAWSEDCALLAPRGVQLSFRLADTVARDVVVMRRERNGDWKALGRVRADKLGRAAWRDTTAFPGRTLELGLSLRTSHGKRFVAMPVVQLAGVGLSLSARPERDGSTTLAFRLPTGYPATLELFDVAGRAVGELDVQGLLAGEHEVRVPQRTFPGRGVYFARLSQRGESVGEKIIVAR